MEKILVVAESLETHQTLSRLLSLRYHLDRSFSAHEAREKIESESYDLVLISTSLSDLDGFRLCALLRNHEKSQILPILLIEQENRPHARAMAFSVGANDLIQMPFNPMEFVAEISAKILFRKAIVRAHKTNIRGPFSINLETQKVVLHHLNQQRDLDLTPIEFKMFVFFTNHEGQPLSREKIQTSIWGKSVHIESRSIDKHISSLRRKLAPFESCIQTTPGLGYCFSLSASDFSGNSQISP